MVSFHQIIIHETRLYLVSKAAENLKLFLINRGKERCIVAESIKLWEMKKNPQKKSVNSKFKHNLCIK